MDERTILHRYKSTSHAGVAGGVMMGVWLLYRFYTTHVFRMDLFVILLVMAVVKLAAMAWYRTRN